MRVLLVLLLCLLLPALSLAQPTAEPAPTVAASLLDPRPLHFPVTEFSTSALPEAPAPQYYPPYPCCYRPPPRSPANIELIVIGVIAFIFLISAAVH